MMNHLLLLLVLFVLSQIETLHFISAFSSLKESRQIPDVKDVLTLVKRLKKPSYKEGNREMLTRVLGQKYNPEYTSINEPVLLKNHQPSFPYEESKETRKMKTYPPMGEKLKQMKFVIKKENGNKREFGKKMTLKFQRWLWNLSKCPVRYRWLDMGENIFPRYVKRGTCSKKKTCSFPAGMKCQESRVKIVDVLIYLCTKVMYSINSVTPSCHWGPMSLHILTECKCACQK